MFNLFFYNDVTKLGLLRLYHINNRIFGSGEIVYPRTISPEPKINERPRKKLNFSTLKECFYKNI